MPAEPPADVLLLAEAELRRRAANPCIRQAERVQFGAMADLFGQIADDMEFFGAVASPKGLLVLDGAGAFRNNWTLALAAARTWLVPAVVVPE